MARTKKEGMENLDDQSIDQGAEGSETPPQDPETGNGSGNETPPQGGNPPASENAEGTDTPIGTVKVENGREMVKVGPDSWVPIIRPAAEPDADEMVQVKIRNESLKGQKVYAPSGKIVDFDRDGIAVVSRKDAGHLLKIPGYLEV